MTFVRENLPEPVTYFEGQGLKLTGPKKSKWKTTNCVFHGGSDSMRIHTERGAFICMSCNAKGGDFLAYHMAAHGVDFVEAARQLGAWQETPGPHQPKRPTPLQPRDALTVLAFESTLTAIAAGNVARGVALSEQDRQRCAEAAARISHIAGAFT